MNQRTKYSLLAAAAVFVLLVGMLLGGLLKGGGKGTQAVANATPSPSDSALGNASPSPSASVSPSPTMSASPSPSPSPSLAADSAASAQGALLTADEAGQIQSGAPDGIDCKALADPGWAVSKCQSFTFSDKLRKSYVVEHHAPENGGSEGWRVLVLKYSYQQSSWIKELSFIDDGGSIATRVTAGAIDLTRDGKPELVIGYHLTGTGTFLGYDVVTALIATPTVAVHREIGNGHAVLANGVITDYEARYGTKGDCCPVDYLKAKVGFAANGWRIQPLGPVATAPAGDL